MLFGNLLKKVNKKDQVKLLESGQHDWQLVARSYAPPARQIPPQVTDRDILDRAMFGVTTLLWQDMITGQTKKEEMLGSDENQLYDILEKVNKYGLQHIDYSGKKFAIAEVPVEGVLPIR